MLVSRHPQARIGVLVSGGLASLAPALWLRDRGVQVTAVAADLGQCAAPEYARFTADLRNAGFDVVTADLREQMAEAALATVAHLAHYDGYWNTTALSRAVLVEHLAPRVAAADCSVLATGCVNGGNDQRRFEQYTGLLAPDLDILALWGEQELCEALPDRVAMARAIAEAGLEPMPGNTAERSLEGNLAGVSHEGADLEDLANPSGAVRRLLGVAPHEAPEDVRTVVVEIEQGRPVGLDGVRLGPADLVTEANLIAGGHGLGLIDVVENRANGTKCRGVYEAPGLEMLATAVQTAYRAAVDRTTAETARYLARRLAVAVYEGHAYGVLARAARAGLAPIADLVTATVRLDLYKGSVVDRALYDVSEQAGTVRQRRFGNGGHLWTSEPLSVGAGRRGWDG